MSERKSVTEEQSKNHLEAENEAQEATANPTASPGNDSLTGGVVHPAAKKDIFDNIEKLRVSTNFTQTGGVKKALVTIPVRKPGAQEFFRVHTSPAYQLDVFIVELKDEWEHYLIDPSLVAYVPSDAKPKMLTTCINAQGVTFLWPLPLSQNGRMNDFTRSALTAVEMAKKDWVRITANMSAKAYDIWEGAASIPDPEFPTQSMSELMRIAFRDKYIDSVDHAVIKLLATIKKR